MPKTRISNCKKSKLISKYIAIHLISLQREVMEESSSRLDSIFGNYAIS